jgi:hypothetical protein
LNILIKDSRIGRQSNLFKHQIIELQRRGFIPNSEYLTNAQRKTKPYKTGTKHENLFNTSNDDYASFLTSQDQMYNMTESSPDYIYNNQAKSEMQQSVYNNAVQPGQNYSMQQHALQANDMMNDYYYGNSQIINENQQNMYNQQPHQLDNHIVQHHQQNQTLQQHHTTLLSYRPPLDTLFDKHASENIKMILKLFLDVKSELMTLTLNEFFNFDNDFDLIIELMRLNSIKFLKFAENIPGKNLKQKF